MADKLSFNAKVEMSISEYNLTTRDSLKRTLKSGLFVRERRESGPEKQKPKRNPHSQKEKLKLCICYVSIKRELVVFYIH